MHVWIMFGFGWNPMFIISSINTTLLRSIDVPPTLCGTIFWSSWRSFPPSAIFWPLQHSQKNIFLFSPKSLPNHQVDGNLGGINIWNIPLMNNLKPHSAWWFIPTQSVQQPNRISASRFGRAAMVFSAKLRFSAEVLSCVKYLWGALCLRL